MKILNRYANPVFLGNILNIDKKKLLKNLLAGFVCIASIGLSLGIGSGRFNPALILVALIVIILLAFLIQKPILGFFGVMLGSMFVPFSWQGGFNLSEIGLAAMLGLWIMEALITRRRFEFIKSRTLLPVLIFIVVSIVSFFLGQFSWYPFARNAPIEAQFGGLTINILSMGGFLLVAHQVNTLRRLEYLTWIFLFLGSIYMIGRFVELDFIDNLFQSGFKAGSLFWIWFTAMLAGQVLANLKFRFSHRLVLGLILLITLYVAVVQTYDWKSGWFPPLVSIAVILAIRYWRVVRYFAIFGLIPFYFLITTSVGAEDWSWGTRMDAWIIVLNIALISPILGMGFANYYWYTPLYKIRGYSVNFNSHSQFVDLVAQTGIVGLACFLWIFIEVGLLGMNLLKKIPEGFAKGYVYGAIGGLAGTLVAAYLVDWVLPFVYNIGLTGFRASILGWLFMGGLVSIEQIYKNEGILI